MTRYFDPANLGLLSDDTHNIPKHAKRLTDEEYEQIKADLCAGKQLAADDDGNPVMNPPNVPNGAALLEMVRGQRQSAYMRESDALKLEAEHDALIAGTEPDYTGWLAKVAEIKARFPLPDQ
jgi:hypothetical protein